VFGSWQAVDSGALIIRSRSYNPVEGPSVMTHPFSPFLAHLLMAGLARRALLHTDAQAESPAIDRAEAPPPEVVEATRSRVQPAIAAAPNR